MIKKLVFAAAALALSAIPAKAVLLGLDPLDWNLAGAATITLSSDVPLGNQVQNLPCIICGANQPQQPTGFGYNLFGNTGQPNQTISYFSTAVVPGGGGSGLALDTLGTGYAIGDGSIFRSIIGNNLTFSIGLDVNDTGTAQTLESFWFLNLTTHQVLAVYSPNPLDGTLVPSTNNGTGFPDYTLNGLSLAGVNPGDQIIFYARITGANDGPDSFFLLPGQQQAVPEASTWMMMIAGFFGVGLLAHRRRQKQLRLA